MKNCPRCHHPLTPMAKYCIACGDKVCESSDFYGAAPQNGPPPIPTSQFPGSELYPQKNGPPTPVNIPNYLVQSILVTVFCCIPFGIAAIIYSAQVNSKAIAGDITGAMESAQKAKKWGWIAFACGAVYVVAILVIQILCVFSNLPK